LVTVKPTCAPHASIGSFGYSDGRLYFYSRKDSARHRNLRLNSHVAVTLVDEWRRQVILEGNAKILGVASELRSHVAADSFRAKYGDFAGDRGSSSYVVEVTPSRIFNYKRRG
jgi:pyridoxine/pyridoxamine 5'-phosphate oxidase